MENNVGRADKAIRGVLAIVCTYLGYREHWVFYIIAAILAITIATGHCGLYDALKISTAGKKGGRKK